MNRSMRGDARYAEASALLERNAVRQRYGLRGGHDDILGRSAERAIGLRPVAPHALADSRARDALPDAVDGPRSIAVGNHARERHAVAESVLTLLDVTRIDSGCSDPDTHLAWLRLRVGQRADDKDVSGWTLLFVPRGVHPARPLRERRLQDDPAASESKFPRIVTMISGSRAGCGSASRLPPSLDRGNGRDDRHVYEAHAHRRRQIHSAHGQALRNQHGAVISERGRYFRPRSPRPSLIGIGVGRTN